MEAHIVLYTHRHIQISEIINDLFLPVKFNAFFSPSLDGLFPTNHGVYHVALLFLSDYLHSPLFYEGIYKIGITSMGNIETSLLWTELNPPKFVCLKTALTPSTSEYDCI